MNAALGVMRAQQAAGKNAEAAAAYNQALSSASNAKSVSAVQKQNPTFTAMASNPMKPVEFGTPVGNNVGYVSEKSPPSYTPPSSPPPPPPAPPLPKFTRMTAPDKNIKVASSDIIQFDDNAVDIALIQDLLFENIGATELANISRTDLIDGQEVIYSPIKNLPSVRREFNPNNIVATSYSTDYFSRFGIDIIQRGVNEPYIDDNGNLVIEVDSVGEAEEIQVQILSNGTIDLIEEI